MGFKAKLVFVTLSIFVFILYLDYVAGAKEKSCKTLQADLTKRQLNGLNNCTKAMKFKNGKEKAKKGTCILKCVMRNEGILNKDYKLDSETIEAFVKREFPPGEIAERAEAELKGCNEAMGADLDAEEELCKSYDPFTRCLLMGFTRVCP